MFNWINIELTSRCNASCHFCGRAKDRDTGKLQTGDMDIKLFEKILSEYGGQLIQINKDGEVLLYPDLWKVGYMCRNAGKITNIVTNGKLLWERRKAVEEFDTVCVSVIEDDIEQFENVRKFTEAYSTPVVIKFLGDYYNPEYQNLTSLITSRSIHHPQGDYRYQEKREPVIPEFGICLDFLMKPAIDWKGYMHICNRYDPDNRGVFGNCEDNTLAELWDSPVRQGWLEKHKEGQREKVPLCSKCTYWGCPTR